MQPALQILPIYLFMLVERSKVSADAICRYGLALAGVVVVAVAGRIVVHTICPGACRTLVPFQAIARALRADGFAGTGTIVVLDFHVGGNLRVQFPHARIVQIGYPPRVWPVPRGRGQCLVVWASKAKVESALDAYLEGELGVPGDARRRQGSVSAPMHGSRRRTYRLNYRLYEESQGECR
jgi:hypothetical protein